jgi:Domain of unknown function (DUF4105)
LNSRLRRLLRILARALATLFVGLPAFWGVLALWYQVPGGNALKTFAVVAWMAFTAACLVALWQGRTAIGLVGFLAAFLGLLLWWQHLKPTNDLLWADDVARMSTGAVEGNRVTLYNVRNFDWRSDSDYTQRWETRHYQLDRLQSVDMIMSYWAGPAIAHMLISFGFSDGEQLAFSVEVRRKQGQEFSEVGGFFKEFGLSIIAADERDVIRVRTNVRGEDDYLYRLNLPVAAMRSLLQAYIAQANGLTQSPRFYNTVTANCTTLVYHMMKHIVGYLPLSYRLLLTGYLPQYVYGLGGLTPGYSFEQLRARGRITERARMADRSASFSQDIRRAVPGEAAQ